MFFLNLLGTIIGLVIGGYILFAGRKEVWATLGVAGLAVAANMLAVLVAGGDSGQDLIGLGAWILIGIAVVIGVLGIVLGRARPDLAAMLIGFIAGADTALWFYEISTHLLTKVANQSDQTALIIGIIILIIGGLLGLWLVRKLEDEALIFITMFVGTRLIHDALGLSSTSSWSAIIMITLALAGVLVQYAVYLRELKADQIEPEPQASSLAFFQDLELDLYDRNNR